MLEKFSNAMDKTIKSEKTLTENGAIGYKTSGKNLVDFNFKMSSYRNLSEKEIINDFIGVYNENPLLAVKMLFFTGDIRQGMGERRVFNVCMKWLANMHPEIIEEIIYFIPEYNRWDSLINLCFIEETSSMAFSVVFETLTDDIVKMSDEKPISLLAKWMPSINTSSKESVEKARVLMKKFGWTEKKYRKTLSSLRKYLDVVEVKMAANKWSEIDYKSVPSKANLLYKEAFMLHDKNRREKYLNDLSTGKEKINSSVAFPYDIVHKYTEGSCYYGIKKNDITLEEMWKSLPDYVNGNGSDTICIVDGSGSMGSKVGNTSISCADVAQSLAIYFSERMSGAFRNKFITFSRNPKLVKFDENWTLREKINECFRHNEIENTDIQKAFMLILKTTIQNNISKDDMPKNILVLSDMEFDSYSTGIGRKNDFDSECKTLFENISKDFEKYGYEMPKLVFWNICSRTNAIPIQENKNGVALVSGFSPTIASMVFSSKLDPYEILIEKLNSKRYDAIEFALEGILK